MSDDNRDEDDERNGKRGMSVRWGSEWVLFSALIH